jgi:hypothetical protein
MRLRWSRIFIEKAYPHDPLPRFEIQKLLSTKHIPKNLVYAPHWLYLWVGKNLKYEMSMISKTPTGMINTFMQITCVSQNLFKNSII